MKERKKFVWTDELVKKYGEHIFTFGLSDDEKIKEFKEYINRGESSLLNTRLKRNK